MSEASLL